MVLEYFALILNGSFFSEIQTNLKSLMYVLLTLYLYLYSCLYLRQQHSLLLLRLDGSHKTQSAENQPRRLFPENQRQPLFRHFANYHRDSVHKLPLFLSSNRLFYESEGFLFVRKQTRRERQRRTGETISSSSKLVAWDVTFCKFQTLNHLRCQVLQKLWPN